MKKIASLLSAALLTLSASAQLTSLSSIETSDVSDEIINFRRVMNSPNAPFLKKIPAPVNGVYHIKNLNIPHFDINYMVEPSKIAYSSSLVPGHPKHPSFSTQLSISAKEITITLEDNNIFLDSDWDEQGNAVKPQDPFKPVWGCMNTQTSYKNSIYLTNGTRIPCRARYTCNHTSQTLSRASRGSAGAYANDKVINGVRHRAGTSDPYPPVNFNHKQTIRYSIPQMASAVGLTSKQLAGMIAMYGMIYIPLNKEVSLWGLESSHKDIMTYTLAKLYNLNEAYLDSLQKRLGKMHEHYWFQLTSKTSDLIKIYKEGTPEAFRTAAREYTGLSERLRPLLRGSKYALASIYDNMEIMARIAASYAKEDNKELDNVIKEAEEMYKDEAYYVYFRFHKAFFTEAYSFSKTAYCAHFGGQMLKNFLANKEAQKYYRKNENGEGDFSALLLAYITSVSAEGRKGNFSYAERALDIYSRFRILEEKGEFGVTFHPNTKLYACEVAFYNSLNQMIKIMEKKPINSKTAYYPIGNRELTRDAKEFYAHYLVALEAYNAYATLFKEQEKEEPTSENSTGIATMQQMLKTKFVRTSEEKALDNAVLEKYRTNRILQNNTGIEMININ